MNIFNISIIVISAAGVRLAMDIIYHMVAYSKTDYPVNTKHLYSICTMLDQRRRRWADVVQML